MMEKTEVLEHLKAAKNAHIKWVEKARLLIDGADIQENSIPVDYTECKFGQWFYRDGQLLNKLSNNPVECMQSIEKLHFKIHEIYLNIFKIYFSENQKKGFFAKVLGLKKQEIDAESKEIAEDHFSLIKSTSEELLAEIERLERRLSAVSDEKIAQLIK
jgi:hypothetical protein